MPNSPEQSPETINPSEDPEINKQADVLMNQIETLSQRLKTETDLIPAERVKMMREMQRLTQEVQALYHPELRKEPSEDEKRKELEAMMGLDLTTEDEIKREFPGVFFRPKLDRQKDDCINRSAEYDCPNESTLEAVCGISEIRCCSDPRCMKVAAKMAKETDDLWHDLRRR